MKYLACAFLITFFTVACASSNAANRCKDTGTGCTCTKGKDPYPGSGVEVATCAPAAGCCSIEKYSDGDYCNCIYDPANPGYGTKSCQEYQTAFIKVPYTPVSKCPQ
ncbi:hypothetical protein BH09MYX1_BH09MYX1_04990 [soil metagenome]